MQRGTFIVLEGIDGTGKATQAALLEKQLTALGHEVATFDFPRYTQPSSYFVKQYLNGVYGGLRDVSPYTAALFYALDRYEDAPEIRAALEAGKVVLANRFSGSSFAHQGAKIANAQERSGFYIWLDNLEFQLLGIPRPNLNIILQADAATAQALVGKKKKRSYTAKTHDIHEADQTHLATAAQVYEELAQLFPRDFQVVDCLRHGVVMDAKVVSDLVWGKIEPLLPAKEASAATATIPSPAAEATAPSAVKLSVLAEANMLAKLSDSAAHAAPTLLVTPHDGAGRWFITPKQLKPKLGSQYRQFTGYLRDTYDELLERLSADIQSREPNVDAASAATRAQAAAQLVLPLATQVSLELPAELGGIKEASAFSISAPDKIMRTIAAMALPSNHTDQRTAVTLISATPADELDLLPQLLYRFSDQTLEQIREEVGKWPYDKKAATLRAYMLSELHGKGSGLLHDVTYSWDLVTDVATFRELAGYAREIAVQAVTPRLGYEVPGIVEQAGLSDKFEACFDRSLEMYSKLQQAGMASDAQYACLLGHRLRWSMRLSLNELISLSTAQPDATHELIAKAQDQHPITVQALISSPPAADGLF